MSRYYHICLAIIVRCLQADAQSINFVGSGVENIGWTNISYSGNGVCPDSYAANGENVTSL